MTTLAYYTNIWTAICFIIVTGILGAWLAQTQGVSTYQRIQRDLAAGRTPTDSLVDGGLILLAGILLITPGVLTDLTGIFLMLPPTRVLARRWLIAWFHRNFKVQSMIPPSMQGGQVVDSYATDSSNPTPRRKVEVLESKPAE